ncbi:carbohydrate-binding module family 1 protein, partial [Piromyces sp. E2]
NTTTTKILPPKVTTTTTKAVLPPKNTTTTKVLPPKVTTTTTKAVLPPKNTTTTTKAVLPPKNTTTTKVLPPKVTTTTKVLPPGAGVCSSTVVVTSTKYVTVTVTEQAGPTQGPNPGNQGNCAAKWAQCGGKDFKGATCCQQGSSCQFVNEYYSQCL